MAMIRGWGGRWYPVDSVLIEHAGLRNYVHWALGAYPAQAGHGSIVISSLAFDATITSLYLPLLCGRSVTLVSEGGEIEQLQRLLLQGQCSRVTAPPCGCSRTPSNRRATHALSKCVPGWSRTSRGGTDGWRS